MDQDGVWRLTNQQAGLCLACAPSLSLLLRIRACLLQVIESVQRGGPVVLSTSRVDLASLAQYKNAWGLPHVLACVCCQGQCIEALAKLSVWDNTKRSQD